MARSACNGHLHNGLLELRRNISLRRRETFIVREYLYKCDESESVFLFFIENCPTSQSNGTFSLLVVVGYETKNDIGLFSFRKIRDEKNHIKTKCIQTKDP